MKGEILHYDDSAGSGQISGEDGIRYDFSRADLKQLTPVHAGMRVDFDFEGRRAFDIYVMPGSAGGMPRYAGPVEPDRGLIDYGIRCLTNNFANFSGRARRKEFWGFYLVMTLIWIVIGVVFVVLFGLTGANFENPTASGTGIFLAILAGLFGLISIIPGFAILARRLHDLGLSGWWVLAGFLVSLIPFIAVLTTIAWIVIGCLDSQPNENKYGVPPKAL